MFLGIALLFIAQAAGPSGVVISEVAWMGTQSSHNEEWIELRNNTASSINLADWTLRAADGSPAVKLTRNDIVSDFYLLKRGKNYTGALENNGEILELYDNLGNLIDKVDASSGWPAGNNTTKQTMEKNNSGWQTSQNPGGTPMAENVFKKEKVEKYSPVQAAIFSEPLQRIRDRQSPKSLYTFLIAAALAVFSGGMILFLKNKLNMI